jgi:hypothetical protein
MAYFHSNYGPLKSIDTSGIQQAGQAYGNMFQQLGKTAASAIEKFREGKEKKEKEDDFKAMGQRLFKSNPDAFSAFGVTSEDEANAFLDAVKKDPEQMQSAIQFATLSQQAQTRKGQEEVSNIFLQPQGPTYTDQYGTFASATGQPAVDRFSGDPRAFLKSIEQSGQMPKTPQGRSQLAGLIQQMAQSDATARRQSELAAAGRMPTRKDQLDVQLKEEQLAEKQKEKKETTDRVTDLAKETTSILDVIAPLQNPNDPNSPRDVDKGKDVTGKIEGTGMWRWATSIFGDNRESEVLRRKLEKYANQFTLENVSKLKGPLSEKELAFIKENAPKMTDEPMTWVVFLQDMEKKLNRAAGGSSSSTPLTSEASQESISELERLRKLRQERTNIR